MDYGMIGKIEKAKFYAQEREQRIHFESFRVRVDGDNSVHTVTYDEGKWHCDCDFFKGRGYCSHSMAMERVLENMVQISG